MEPRPDIRPSPLFRGEERAEWGGIRFTSPPHWDGAGGCVVGPKATETQRVICKIGDRMAVVRHWNATEQA